MPEPAPGLPVTMQREFWALTGYATLLGIFGAFAGLASLRVIKFGSTWGTGFRLDWFGGHWWWVGITAAAGVAVGLLRVLTHLPEEIPSLFQDLQADQFDAGVVPATMAVSALSLIGGASVGPEKVLASMGGGAGSWMARRRRLSDEDRKVNTLAGIAGMFGGLFSSPLIVVLMILEVARPGGVRFSKTLVTDIAGASISFGIYFAIAGAVFLGAYQVPPYAFADWQLLAAIPLGLFGALVTAVTAGLMTLAVRVFRRLRVPAIAKSLIGGIMFGIVGVILPLTMFAGGDQLTLVLNHADELGLGLGVAILIAKMLTCAVSQGSGFVGGPIFPSLFIGGTAGVVVHQAIPGVPLGLAFSCLLPAVLGTLAAAPFSMVLMAALLTRVGALQTSPILITVVTTFLGVTGVRYFVSSHEQGGSWRRSVPRH